MNRELIEGTSVISSLNVTFTYPTAQLKDTICKKFTDSWHFHTLFVFQLNVLMCWALMKQKQSSKEAMLWMWTGRSQHFEGS